MIGLSTPHDVYSRGRARCAGELESAQGRSLWIARARLASFAALLLAGWLAYAGHLGLWWMLVPATGFIALVIRHEREHRRIDRARRGVAHYDQGLSRLDGTWPGRGNVRADLAPSDHPYARDLDLFGHGSVFEMLCTARTAAGEQALASWLLAPADLETLERRREAIRELVPAVGLREDLASVGASVRAEVDPAALAKWGEGPPLLDERQRRRTVVLSWVLPPFAVLAATLWLAGVISAAASVAATIALAWFHRDVRGFTKSTQAAIERPARELAVVAESLARLERESFAAPLLVELRAALVHGNDSASTRIRGLRRWAEWLHLQNSQIFAIVAWFLCWGEHFCLGIERWRLRNGRDVARWFHALGELEALGALSARAFEQPADVWPELVTGETTVVGSGLGHPLLAAQTSVSNDVALGTPVRALVISGSNIAGKSTYMRTVGVNVVLALAGAPVRATALRLSVVQLGASIRVEDSLRDGASRFYAEITRLRQIVELSGGAIPVLFLLDEVLHGTNSSDRRVGARGVLLRLVELGAVGMMTTHDLALAMDVERDAPRIRNVHFCDELHGDRLVFDYRLRDGIVQTSNALALMRAVGLQV